MVTVHILGSCAGTEPMPGRMHTSLALTVGKRLYFFDAGEGCSWTAHWTFCRHRLSLFLMYITTMWQALRA